MKLFLYTKIIYDLITVLVSFATAKIGQKQDILLMKSTDTMICREIVNIHIFGLNWAAHRKQA